MQMLPSIYLTSKIKINILIFGLILVLFSCINGYLKSKVRILVTHQVHHLSKADHIIVLNGVCARNFRKNSY